MSKINVSIEQLGSATAYTEYSNAVRFAELWSEMPAVLVFVRHFG